MKIFNDLKYIYIIFAVTTIPLFSNFVSAGTLSCSVTTTCASGAIIYRMASTTNSHGELGTESNYTNMVCCTGITGISNSCSGTFATVLDFSSTTNAHAEKNTFSNFADASCLSVPSGGSVTVGYKIGDCVGYDTMLGSIESDTNSHIGNGSAYSNKICGTANGTQSLTFSISDNTIGFGTLLSVASSYATGDTLGAGTDTSDAHTLSASTNAVGGYIISLQGNTLTSGSSTVTAIGATAVAPSIGTKQFGARIVLNSGTGTTTSPYNTNNWAYDTASFPDIISSGTGDASTSVFGMRYLSNISADTISGSYSAVITYVVTVSF